MGETTCTFLKIKLGLSTPEAELTQSFKKNHTQKLLQDIMFAEPPNTSMGKIQKLKMLEKDKGV